MAVVEIDWPEDEYMAPMRVEWGLSDPALLNRSVFSGSVQTASDPFARWMVVLQMNNRALNEQHQRAAWLGKLSGRSKRVKLWNHARPEPSGTLRGSPTLSVSAAQFADTITIAGTNGQTLAEGDMIGLGAMLLTVVTGGTVASGTLAVTVAPRLRVAATAGAAIVWDKPKAQFVMTTDRAMVPWARGIGEPFSLAFEETW